MDYEESYDYVVVGSGAGGGVVAARLAEAGMRVLLLEAGSGAVSDSERLPGEPTPRRSLEDDYAVPAFHAFCSEHPDIRWDFWVQHYENAKDRARDPKYRPQHDGVLYPRSSTLGGCTAHHAMIIVRPQNADWNHIWATTGDRSWRASNMAKYFRRIERCRHRSIAYRLLARLGWNPTGHGWSGWLETRKAIPLRAFLDCRMLRAIRKSVDRIFGLLPDGIERWNWLAVGHGDPNDERLVDDNARGLRYIPLSTGRCGRLGTRELLHRVRKARPERLTIREDALVTRVEIDPDTRRATGVVYRSGRKLYRACPGGGGGSFEEHRVGADREVILAGGAFNTPQLLMLSGVGDPEQLGGHGIDVVEPLVGVGRNLQDRYEVGVVNRMREPWKLMEDASFDASDRHYRRFQRSGRGLYASNGGILSVMLRSKTDRVLPDLFCLAFLADFRGYEPGYSGRVTKPDYLSWVVLKAYTSNNAGEVRLRSSDPTDTPEIRFRYFEDGNGESDDDLAAVVAGIRVVRKVVDSFGDLVEGEETPGRHLYTDEQLKEHVRTTAWGHHACGTCAMKPRGDGGVVDSDFRVYGIKGLRIVDASVLPRIPGYFIVTSVYMIAEKAADVILGR